MKFWFYNRMSKRGTFLNGLSFPNRNPLSFFLVPFFWTFFLIPIPIVSVGEFPKNGGDTLLPPLYSLLSKDLGKPIRGADPPEIFFITSIASGTPIDANRVPSNPPVFFCWSYLNTST